MYISLVSWGLEVNHRDIVVIVIIVIIIFLLFPEHSVEKILHISIFYEETAMVKKKILPWMLYLVFDNMCKITAG